MLRMLGTFNQHLPMILSNNYLCNSKPTSWIDTDMCVIPWSVQQSLKNVLFIFHIEIYRNSILPKLLAKINYGTTPVHGYSFYKKCYYTKGFPSTMREPVARPGALSHQKDKINKLQLISLPGHIPMIWRPHAFVYAKYLSLYFIFFQTVTWPVICKWEEIKVAAIAYPADMVRIFTYHSPR